MKFKKSCLSIKEVIVLTALIAAIAFAGTRFTRANLEISGGEYTAQISMSEIGVALLENGKLVSRSGGNGEVSTHGKILDHLLDADEKYVTPGKTYDEILSTKNVGKIDEYVRIVLVKRWVDENGVPLTNLSPDLIQIHLLAGENEDWLIDESAKTEERTILYYRHILPVDESAVFADQLTISDEILQSVKTVEKDGIVTVSFDYEGAFFELDIEVDGVQTNNAEDAILSAWGVSVEIDENGKLSLKAGGSENENME